MYSRAICGGQSTRDHRYHWMALHCLSLALHRIVTSVWYCTALHCTALHCTVLHCTALHCTALRCTALHCTALHCTALHCTELHCTELHCTVMYWTALHWTALHWTALHCTVLNCTTLHCTALHWTLNLTNSPVQYDYSTGKSNKPICGWQSNLDNHVVLQDFVWKDIFSLAMYLLTSRLPWLLTE